MYYPTDLFITGRARSGSIVRVKSRIINGNVINGFYTESETGLKTSIACILMLFAYVCSYA